MERALVCPALSDPFSSAPEQRTEHPGDRRWGRRRPRNGGASLRMWKKYFPRSRIYAIDIHDKSALQEDRIQIFRGSQADEGFLNEVFKQIGSLDIVIDDGSHVNAHVLTSFRTLFPLLKEGGIYAAEDLQTPNWKHFGGNSVQLNDPVTSMGFFKKLIDGLNYAELERPDLPTQLF